MSVKLVKYEAVDDWAEEAGPVPAPAPAGRPAPDAMRPGITPRGLGAMQRHGLLGASAEDAPAADRPRAIAAARQLVDQAYAVPAGGWVEGGGLWTVDRHSAGDGD